MKSLTKHEQDLKNRKAIGEFKEELDTLGQDSEEKAAKWVIEKGKEDRKKADEAEARILEGLEKEKNKRFTHYHEALYKTAKRKILEYGVPPKYYMDCQLTPKGLLFGFRSYASKKWEMKGMKITMIPRYDLFAIIMMINDALDEISKREKVNGSSITK